MKHGFTLIELIVSVSVIIIITGGAISAYNSYNDQQKIRQAALTLKADLRLAQASSSGSRLPTSGACTDFVGFTVSGTENSYTIEPECVEGTDYDEAVTTTLVSGLTLSLSPATFTFYPLNKGVSDDATVTIGSNGTDYTCVVSVTRIGSVNEVCQ